MHEDDIFQCNYCGREEEIEPGCWPRHSWVDGAGYIIGTCKYCGHESIWKEQTKEH